MCVWMRNLVSVQTSEYQTTESHCGGYTGYNDAYLSSSPTVCVVTQRRIIN